MEAANDANQNRAENGEAGPRQPPEPDRLIFAGAGAVGMIEATDWHTSIALGFQHFLVMLGTTALIPSILVPILGGGHEDKAAMIQTTLFVSGLSTLLQSWCGSRLPVVMGGSYTFIIPAVSASHRFQKEEPHLRFTHSMRAIQGALLLTSVFHVLIGVLIMPTFGRLLCPLTTIPIVILVGLGMFVYGFPQLSTCAVVGLPTLAMLFFIAQCLPYIVSRCREEQFNRFRFLRHLRAEPNKIQRFALLFLVPLAWPFVAVMSAAYGHTHSSCRVHLSGLFSGAHGLWIPNLFQWGSPTLDVRDVATMTMAVLVSSIESTGTFLVASRYGLVIPPPPLILSRGVICQGIGTLLAGCFGTGTGSTALVENAGLLGLTRHGSRRAVEIAAAFMISFSIIGKFGAFLASLSLPIVGAVHCLLCSYVVSGGMSFIDFCNSNSYRVNFIMGFPVILGISVASYCHESLLSSGVRSSWWRSAFHVIFSSPASLGAAAAIIMDIIVEKADVLLTVDSGRTWWDFRVLGLNIDENYSLPENVQTLLTTVRGLLTTVRDLLTAVRNLLRRGDG